MRAMFLDISKELGAAVTSSRLVAMNTCETSEPQNCCQQRWDEVDEVLAAVFAGAKIPGGSWWRPSVHAWCWPPLW